MTDMATQLIDIHNYSKSYESRLRNLRVRKDILVRNKKIILKFLHDCELGKMLKNRAKKKIGRARMLKYISNLSKLSEWFNKPFDEVSERDMERLIRSLDNNKYKKESGEPFAEQTKVDFKKTIKKFFKWLLKDNPTKFYQLTSWIETYEPITEVSALTRAEVEKLANVCKIREKALILFLFDSGVRMQELLNIRIKDLTFKDDGDYYMVRIKFSKTKPRTISVPIATSSLKLWLEMHPDKNNPDAQLFPLSYDAVRISLFRIGIKVLKKRVNPHLLRHSSATFYCHKLNQYQLSYRYGWSMASKQPQRYIDREGIREEATAEKVKEDELETLRQENKHLKESVSILKSEQERNTKILERIKEKDSFLADTLEMDKKLVISIINTIRKNKGQKWLKNFLEIS